MSIRPISRNRRKGPKSPAWGSFVSSLTDNPAVVRTNAHRRSLPPPTDSRRGKPSSFASGFGSALRLGRRLHDPTATMTYRAVRTGWDTTPMQAITRLRTTPYWRGAAAITVSVVGWVLALRALFLMAFPHAFMAAANAAIGVSALWVSVDIFIGLVGLYLTYVGWARYRVNQWRRRKYQLQISRASHDVRTGIASNRGVIDVLPADESRGRTSMAKPASGLPRIIIRS